MTTIVGVGNWSAQDRGGIMRGTPPGPWICFLRRLRRVCRVVVVDEHRTSKLCCACHTSLHAHQYMRVRRGEEKLVDVWDTKRCTNKGCNVNVVNRDVNGAANILMLAKVSRALARFRSGPPTAKDLLACRGRLARGLPRQQPARSSASVARAASTLQQASPASPAAAAVLQKLTAAGPGVLQLYRSPGLSASKAATLLKQAQAKTLPEVTEMDTELCYNISLSQPLTAAEAETLAWLLRETFEPERLTPDSSFQLEPQDAVVEVGPRMNFSTAWSANAVSICASCGLGKVERVEVSRRFRLRGGASTAQLAAFAASVHDRMTEEVYPTPLTSFASSVIPAPVFTVPVVSEGRAALERVNASMGLAFDDRDLDYYTDMFRSGMARDPTNVELFDIAQSNSEHSRHWFFRAALTVDGAPVPESLMGVVKSTLAGSAPNSVLAFKDNSSAIRGGPVRTLLPETPGAPSALAPARRDLDLLLTAETHNFPCAVAPYPGAETGAGGRIRDTHATGIGSLMGAATAGYCVGNLLLEGYDLPWEQADAAYPPSLAHPRQILTDASNGASDYGNKFGEPLVAGYTRSFGQRLADGSRREWLKPIMFSGGLGQIDHGHLEKTPPGLGMLVVKIGGPAYRIGMGGGAASSLPSGSNSAELDYDAVQRGDAEVSQKLWRVVRACVELGPANPILSIHDQGAGGNCNVVKEIIYPLGAEIDVRAVHLGDATMSVLEIWGAEYQENDCLLIAPKDRPLLEALAARERCGVQVIGTIDGSGRVRVVDRQAPAGAPTPVDLDLELVLGDMPDKAYAFSRSPAPAAPLDLAGATPADALDRVLRLPAVASKRFLTNKVDRCVTGLVAQQQAVGPLHTPLADVAVVAQSLYGRTGAATSIGEAPLKGLLDPAAMARLAVGEALTNLVWAPVTALEHVKASVNWMYAAKMGGEGAAMVDAALAMREAMAVLRIGVDGGKDSLSMAAAAGGETVMAPGNLVYSQLGDEAPDVDPALLGAAFRATQALLATADCPVLAGHDVSDGGLVVAALEMAFAGNCGLELGLEGAAHARDAAHGALAPLFAEELGLLLEVAAGREGEVLAAYAAAGVPCARVGASLAADEVRLAVGGEVVVAGGARDLRDVWEATSFELEKRQTALECVESERAALRSAEAPTWVVPYVPAWTPADKLDAGDKVRVAVIREEGTNGDREMAAAVQMAGMEPWDVTMSDLLSGAATLDSFQGIIFPGGFSYADVLDSAKGWAATIRFNSRLLGQFQAFYARPDTFSLGCRWSSVAIDPDTPAVMLRGMGGARLGVWVAHGEGQALFPDEAVRRDVLDRHLAPIRYVDAVGRETQEYPYNPNGSSDAVAALCSPCGRHLALMPHPERCLQMWQNPWWPAETGLKPTDPSPWLKLFQNAAEWAASVRRA
ncbi:putative phosphoribosylformylglycinamidine synthase, chloroplastic/mitochondrial [Auxenochlorella protothecoides]|uniref:phosphoribosylformylglycinamidine synthase n=1 Tax=Auxenochlorella protothecoides TaxID=3075 RepID=A0A087SAP3_AUXPR|nr:putative phosphoribosylformylglycinamidine synthase, chloroplastic/mitochondrial [Auxenochlorella protothecoides]KFM22797.1 putative phosphoribosylformylglycinamidine synthase, chloroplastic/mitochondrial [Auxenochlorella protothecoides]